MKTQQSMALMLALFLAVEAAPFPNQRRALEQLKQPKTRAQAIQSLGEMVYSLNNSKQRGQICAALMEHLRLSKNPRERRQLAALLESYLSHEKTPALSFEKAEPWLLDAERQVRHSIWLAFYQQASQPHLTPIQDDRLLQLTQSNRPEIRKESLNWANEATQNRQSVVGQSQSELGQKTLKIQLDLSNDPDTTVRNLAIYGCFQQLPYARHQVSLIAGQHLADGNGGIRSLVLDFLQQAARRDDKLCQLQPIVLERFRQPIATGNFPLIPDRELGPDASPPLDERYRLVLVAASMGPLPEVAWTYLREEAPSKVPFELLLNLARLQDKAARPLLAKIVNQQNFPLAADVLAECGLPDDHYAAMVKAAGGKLNDKSPTVLDLRGLGLDGKRHDSGKNTGSGDDTFVVLGHDKSGKPTVTELKGATHAAVKQGSIAGGVAQLRPGTTKPVAAMTTRAEKPGRSTEAAMCPSSGTATATASSRTRKSQGRGQQHPERRHPFPQRPRRLDRLASRCL